MEFKISHINKALYYAKDAPFFLIFGMAVFYVLLGITFTENMGTAIFFFAFSVINVIVVVILNIICFIETVKKWSITVEKDHIYIKTLFRRKRIYFDEIADVKYDHYYIPLQRIYRSKYRRRYGRKRKETRTRMTIYLTSGKICTVNNSASEYIKMKKAEMADPSVVADENEALYQAYQCYRVASDTYYYSK